MRWWLKLGLITTILVAGWWMGARRLDNHPKITSPLPSLVGDPVRTRPQTSLADNQFLPGELSLEQIFLPDHRWVATLSADRVRVLVATGDVMLGRSVNSQTVKSGNFLWPFEKTAALLQEADLTLINLESPLVADCPVTDKGMIFCGDLRHTRGLAFAGVDLANLANNHAGNHHALGIEQMVEGLAKVGIVSVGLSGPVYQDVRGLRFAFLGYNDVGSSLRLISQASEGKIQSEIQLAKRQADLVVVSFHWGAEYASLPTKRQKDLAHLAVDSGADLVIGHHPHWIQPVEVYQGKVIVYSHGNFIFDQMWSQKTKEGLVGRYLFYDDQLVDVGFSPVEIVNYGQPYFVQGEQKERILNDLNQ